MTQTVFPFINIISCCISISFSLCLLFVLYALLFLLMRKTEKNCFACIIEHTITELSFRMLINLFFQMDKRNENLFCMFAGKQLYTSFKWCTNFHQDKLLRIQCFYKTLPVPVARVASAQFYTTCGGADSLALAGVFPLATNKPAFNKKFFVCFKFS